MVVWSVKMSSALDRGFPVKEREVAAFSRLSGKERMPLTKLKPFNPNEVVQARDSVTKNATESDEQPDPPPIPPSQPRRLDVDAVLARSIARVESE